MLTQILKEEKKEKPQVIDLSNKKSFNFSDVYIDVTNTNSVIIYPKGKEIKVDVDRANVKKIDEIINEIILNIYYKNRNLDFDESSKIEIQKKTPFITKLTLKYTNYAYTDNFIVIPLKIIYKQDNFIEILPPLYVIINIHVKDKVDLIKYYHTINLLVRKYFYVDFYSIDPDINIKNEVNKFKLLKNLFKNFMEENNIKNELIYSKLIADKFLDFLKLQRSLDKENKKIYDELIKYYLQAF